MEGGADLVGIGVGQRAESREAIVAIQQDVDVLRRQEVLARAPGDATQDHLAAGNPRQRPARADQPVDRRQVFSLDHLPLPGRRVEVGDDAGVAPDRGFDRLGAQPAGQLDLPLGPRHGLQIGQARLPLGFAGELDDVPGVDVDAQVTFDRALRARLGIGHLGGPFGAAVRHGVDVRGRATDIYHEAVTDRLGEQLGTPEHRARRGQDASSGQLLQPRHARCVDDVTIEGLLDQAADGVDVEHVDLGKDVVGHQRLHAGAFERLAHRLADRRVTCVEHRDIQFERRECLGVAQDRLPLPEVDSARE